VERIPNHIKWLPRNYPFDEKHLIKNLLDCDAILMPKRLDMSWYEAICLPTGGMDIVFKTTSELAKFIGVKQLRAFSGAYWGINPERDQGYTKSG
jgi:hypothetical protein